MTLTIDLPPEMERRLEAEAARTGRTPPEFVRDLVSEKLLERNRAAMALLDQWLAEGPDHEDETWPEFQAALEADHPSSRKIFSE